MSWGLETNSAAANFENWLGVIETIVAKAPLAAVSLYNRRLLIDEQLLVALRGHNAFLTPSGIVANPHWLPAQLLTRGTLRQQIDFWFGAVSADLAESPAGGLRPCRRRGGSNVAAAPRGRGAARRRRADSWSAGRSDASAGCASIAATVRR